MTVTPPFLDLRPLIDAGTDPMAFVIDALAPQEAGWSGHLDAPFDPLPLRRLLARMDYSSTAEKIGERHWRIHLVRDGLGRISASTDTEFCLGPAVIGATVTRMQDGAAELDLRGLAPPLPMLAILRVAAHMKPDETIHVVLEREPVMLYPELVEIGWEIICEPTESLPYRYRLGKAQ